MNTETLRKKILDLAIRGKLVPQDPNDEPASVLLERIRTQKAQMVKDGKLKAKDVKNDTIIYVGEDNLHYEKFADGTIKCIEEEIPFPVPDGWEWERLSNIAAFSGGKTPSTTYLEYWGNEVPWVTSKDMKSKYITASQLYLSTLGAEQLQIYSPNTILLVVRSGILRHTLPISILKTSATVNQDLKAISLYLPELVDYVYIYLKGMELYILQNYMKSGTTVENIKFDEFKNILLPIAPNGEIEKITIKVSRSNKAINNIELEKAELTNYIDKIKSKILDLAIHGKLVLQNDNDEPASVLLERIRAEKEELIKQGKIKRDKRESIIYRGVDNSYYERFADGSEKCIDEEIPFEIPKGWAWGRIFSITTDLSYGTAKKSLTKGKIAVIRMGNIQAGEINYDDLMYSSDEADILRYCLEKNDLLFNRTNSPDLVGKTAIYRGDMPAIYAGYLIRIHTFIDSEYLNIVMNSNYARRYYNLVKTDGVNQSNINAKNLAVFIIPIPPFEEQRRIAKQEKTIRSILFECMR